MQLPLFRCGIVKNTDTTIRKVRLWIYVNGLKFDISLQMFGYYDYLTISSSIPDSSLVHLTNKEITISTMGAVNSVDLSCVYIGNENGLIVAKALYVSMTELVCPLTYRVFENTLLTVHITNNYTLFKAVN